ncbi:MAG: peptide/nickel transport system permease protein [Thermomicrobiales bacterium]|nr:peptide/nickel transport system permease protein [Thermomicrobiales bacterium]MEA2583660.1 peptide/nickel transport system permease protein [Thermomicrobiales bacterium]
MAQAEESGGSPAAGSASLAGATPRALAVAARAPRRPSMWSAIRRQRLALTGTVIIAFFVAVAIIGPAFAPHGETEQFTVDRLQGPSARYPFGTDEFGRDVLSRLLHGARISFQVGAIVVGIAGTAGVLLGMIAGYRGDWVDNIITLLMDVIYAFPAVLLAIAVITLLGNNLRNAIIAISLVYMPPFVRVVRGASITVRHTAYIEAARSLGATTPRILSRHVFPNITAPLIVQTSLSFAFAILSEAGLAFLGLGNKAPAPSWGSMVSTSYSYLQVNAWAAIFPGVAIALTVLGFNLLGDGLRDALDPRLRS